MKMEFTLKFICKILDSKNNFINAFEFDDIQEMALSLFGEYGSKIVSLKYIDKECVYSLQEICVIYECVVNEVLE